MRAGRDDHGPRGDTRVVVDLDGVRLPRAREPACILGDHDLRAEFHRLRGSAPREVEARHSCGEPEVVLDVRALSGLTARCVGLDDQDVEPLRRAVDGRRKPRRPAADDNDVADVRAIDRVVESKTVGDLAIARIAEHDVAATDEDGNLIRRDVESIEERLHVRVVIEIDVRERMPVPRQELLDAQRLRRVHRPDEHRVADAVRDQLEAAVDERPHQDLADLGVGLHERQQLRPGQLDELAGSVRAHANQRTAPDEHTGLTGECAGAQCSDHRVGQRRRPHNLEATGFDDEKRCHLIAGVDEDLAVVHAPERSVRLDPRDVRRTERRKHGSRPFRADLEGLRPDIRHDDRSYARASGTSTTCSARNQTCCSFCRMTLLTSKSFVPSSPASAARRAIARAS